MMVSFHLIFSDHHLLTQVEVCHFTHAHSTQNEPCGRIRQQKKVKEERGTAYEERLYRRTYQELPGNIISIRHIAIQPPATAGNQEPVTLHRLLQLRQQAF